MSEAKRSRAEFQRPRDDAFAATVPGANGATSRQLRKLQRADALWQGSEEPGGDPYNATGRHAIGPRVKTG